MTHQAATKQAQRIARLVGRSLTEPGTLRLAQALAAPTPEPSIQELALKACRTLAEVYRDADAGGSINWEDLDTAHAQAMTALEAAGEAIAS